ncbi:MAG: hypothetical protein M4579_005131 [Chaenotheca gracillima]|nr:MAG: hypothetical protein M4579_005131 [Chaenotheca gracillima]
MADSTLRLTPQSDVRFHCALCNKAFDRIDLQNRHQRRCKTTSRVSKRKACNVCVQTKSKCCFTRPTCHRCETRGEICRYPSPSLRRDPAQDQPARPELRHEEADQNDLAMSTQFSVSNGPHPVQSSKHSTLPVPSIMDGVSDLEWNFDSDLVDDSFWLRFRDVPFDLPSHASDGVVGLTSAVTPAPGLTEAPSGSRSRSPTTRGSSWTSSSHGSPTGLFGDAPGLSQNPTWNQLDPSHTTPSLSTELQMSEVDRSTADVENYPPNSGAFDAAAGPGRSTVSTGTAAPEHGTFYPTPENLHSTRSTSSQPPTTTTYNKIPVHSESKQRSVSDHYGHRELLAIIRRYTKLVATDGYRSPFVHHKLYRGAHADMTMMAKSTMAICCASAFGNQGNTRFVRKAVAAEQERLVRDFHLFSCVEEWDALHAMCIYQIVEPLDTEDEGYTHPGMRTGDLHIPFLLKMARRFCQNHTSALDFNGADDADWLSWLVAETVRRTLFLIHMINVLIGRDDDTGNFSLYYEPLDDAKIAALPLPAPTEMWEARSAHEWRAARERTGWVGDRCRTFSSVLSESKSRSTERGSAAGGDHDSVLADLYFGNPGLGDSAELRDLVVACGLLA